MSRFMHNLIDRHQQSDVMPEVSRIVQPRPKARFESNSGVADFIHNETEHDDAPEQATRPEPEAIAGIPLRNAKASEPVSHSGQTLANISSPALQSTDNEIAETDTLQPIATLNQRVDILSAKFGAKNSASTPPIKVLENITYQQEEPRYQPEWSENIVQPDNQSLFVEEELKQRIQETLQYIDSQKLPASTGQNISEVQQEPLVSELNPSATGRVEYKPHTLEPAQNAVEPSITFKETEKESNPVQVEESRPGVLQTPDWLFAMQARLNTRLQGNNSSTTVEPVVNVTIGRVEVRAVREDLVKQPKARAKPSGVMSLDDYLKQRDSRGRA